MSGGFRAMPPKGGLRKFPHKVQKSGLHLALTVRLSDASGVSLTRHGRAWWLFAPCRRVFARQQISAVIVEIPVERLDAAVGDEQETVGCGFQQTPVMP